jgi:hypothetical protein
LPDGGELVAQFTDFHPARGARLVSGQGAYVRVQWEMPRRAVLVSAAGDAWDGARCCPPPSEQQHSVRLARLHDRPSDAVNPLGPVRPHGAPALRVPTRRRPDVPFVRVRLWITDWPYGCDGNLPMPPIAEIQASTPALTAVERVDWRRP